MPLEDESRREVFGKVKKIGDSYAIPNDSKRKYYVKYDAIGVNVIERKRIPYFHKLPVARIFSGNYILCYIDTQQAYQAACDLKVDSPSELVMWELKVDEEVVFHFSDFVAMSEEVKIASRISLKLSSLIFGRVIYHYATGPGLLIVRTKSSSISGTEERAEHSLNANGLVAWNANNEFNVVSSLTSMDTFFSGCSLRKTKGDLIIYDTSQTRRKAGMLRGIWRIGRTFLLPF